MKQFLLLAALLVSLYANAAGYEIRGLVADGESNEPLVAATVALASSDSTLVGGTMTDAGGRFKVVADKNGDYIVRLQYIGYEQSEIALTNLNGDIDLGVVGLRPSAAALDEVVVEADPVIKKIDRQIVLPTDAQQRAATNGISLLQNIQLPGLSINPVDKTISTIYGDGVQLRINGVQSSKEEVMAIRPADVIRIEYHDNPGLRYGGAAAVVDYIVKRKDNGGNIAGDFTNGVTEPGYGEYNFSAKYSRGRSAVTAVAYWEHRDLKWNRENYETFNYPDKIVANTEIGQPTKFKYDMLNASVAYNYNDGEKHLLNIALRNQYNNTPNSFFDRNSTLVQDGTAYSVSDRSRSKSVIPSLDVYYQLNLKNDRHLYFDVVGTYLDSHNSRNYVMTAAGKGPSLIYSETDGNKYSVIGEAIYEQQLGKGRLTAGLKHTQSWMDNIYDGDISSKVRMDNAETYAFAEWQHGVGSFNYSAGLGAMRTYYKQGTAEQEKYILRPTITLSYNAPHNIFLRYNTYISGYSPSLSDLSDVEQEMDVYQVRRGNPDLKSVTFYSNSITASWRSKYVNVELSGRYSYDDKPIMEQTFFDDGEFVRTTANQKGFNRINLTANVQIMPFKEHIRISLTPYFNRYISVGSDYLHTHSNPGFRGSIIGIYKNWMVIAEMNTSYHELWGETISKGERLHTIAAGYNGGKWSLQAMVVNPFSKHYSQDVVNLSKAAPYTAHAFSNSFNHMVMLNFSFNLDFGKHYNDGGKRINNSDTDTGILSGTK